MGNRTNYERGMYKHLQKVMLELENTKEEFRKERQDHKEELKILNIQIEQLMKENTLLRSEVARLRSIINNDSSNSSLPPSSDQKPIKPANVYNGRTKTERHAGGQVNRKGTTLTKKEVEEKIRTGKCKHEIKTIGNPLSGKYISKYVVDLKIDNVITEIRIYADDDGKIRIPKEYHSDVTYGEVVKALAVTLYGEGVMSNDRIASFLNAMGAGVLSLSEGSIYNFCKKLADISEETISNLESELLNQPIVATDATTVTVNGKQSYIRNFSIPNTVVYHAMESKSIDALKEIDFLPKYNGILLHDHETALYHFGLDHVECNVHLLRYLRKNSEETHSKWSDEMISLLCEINNKRKSLIEQDSFNFSKDVIQEYEQKYFSLLQKGRKENENTLHSYAKNYERALLNRLEKYSHNHLMFIRDFSVPFDNNISERDLRKAKNRQKMAGGFRKKSGHKMYCSILTIIETLKRRSMGIVENIKLLFRGAPAIFSRDFLACFSEG